MDEFERIPREIFDEAGMDLDERLLNFMVAAAQHSQFKGPWVQATATVFSSKVLEAALNKHATALTASADAAERPAASLARATWALVLATVVLGLVAAIPFITKTN